MRSIPVDASRLSLIATGKAVPKVIYAELSDGSRRRTDRQATDDAGVPLWTVDVLVDDDAADRAEVIGVTVPSAVEPTVQKFRQVAFRGVTARLYRDNMSGQPKVSLIAESIDAPAVKPVPAANAGS